MCYVPLFLIILINEEQRSSPKKSDFILEERRRDFLSFIRETFFPFLFQTKILASHSAQTRTLHTVVPEHTYHS